ncbi:MAG: hypothetical protein ACK46X_11060, partial [Candidatus Sericytochromatia bacterium]
MNQTGHHDSLWTATAPGRAFPALDRDLWVDVAVVGGGITGLTAAFALQRLPGRIGFFGRARVRHHRPAAMAGRFAHAGDHTAPVGPQG